MPVQVYEMVEQHAALPGPGHNLQPCSSHGAMESAALIASQVKPAHLLTGLPLLDDKLNQYCAVHANLKAPKSLVCQVELR